jgi:DNA-binding response OmpR family regulator
VDHDPTYLALMAELLEDEGYGVAISVPDSGRVTTVTQAFHPDVVLLEILRGREPEAWDVLQALKQDPATASTAVLVCAGALHCVADHVPAGTRQSVAELPRPFEVGQLLASIRELATSRAN